MKPRPINILAALYLIVFLLIALTWANDSIPFIQRLGLFHWFPHENKKLSCDINNGNITFAHNRYYPNPYYQPSGGYRWAPLIEIDRIDWSDNWHGFISARSHHRDWDEAQWYTTWQIGAPAWFLCLFSLILPILLVFRRYHAKHGPKPGHCLTCSYDLRAHLAGPPGTRCPECGTPVPQYFRPHLHSLTH